MSIQVLSEYYGDGNNRKAEVIKEGKWFIARLIEDGKVVDHVTGFDELKAEVAAEDWVNDTI